MSGSSTSRPRLHRHAPCSLDECAPRGKVEGASTITQQLARSLFLSERTFDRKVHELIHHKMELVLTKEQILELYLNQIYFGQGAYGVASAAQTYFGKDLSALTIAESAFLAGLPKSPNHYSPFKAYDRAKKRQEHVLARMEEAGFLSAAEREQAAAETLNFRRPGVNSCAYFVGISDSCWSRSWRSDGVQGRAQGRYDIEHEMQSC
jgi:penicillin-binding protein 1A